MRSMSMKGRLILIGIMNIIGASFLIINRYIAGTEFLKGIGVGLLLVGLPGYFYLLYKYNNKDVREEYDLSVHDERVQQNCDKANALGFRLQTMFILVVVVICHVLEIELFLPIMAVLLITIAFVKVYTTRLNK